MMKNIMKIGVPCVLSLFFAFFVEVINQIYIGHIGTKEMIAGVGLGNMYLNITTLSLLMGMNGALSTFVS